MSLLWIYLAWKYPKGIEPLFLIMGGFLAMVGVLTLILGLITIGVPMAAIGAACLAAIWFSRRRAP